MGYKRMDKGRRNELTKLKFKKRLSQVGLSMEDVEVTAKEFILVPCGFFDEKDHTHELN